MYAQFRMRNKARQKLFAARIFCFVVGLMVGLGIRVWLGGTFRRPFINKSIDEQDPVMIVVGLPKTGTTTLNEFFRCSGFSSSHYCTCESQRVEYPCTGHLGPGKHDPASQISTLAKQNLEKGYPILSKSILGHCQMLTQIDGEDGTSGYFLPQHFHLQELFESVPNAIWILTTRDAHDWARSVENWLDMGSRIRHSYLEHDDRVASLPLLDFLVEFYHRHDRQVRAFAARNKSFRLVEVDFRKGRPWEAVVPLHPSFRERFGASCWKRENKGPFFRVIQKGKVSRR